MSLYIDIRVVCDSCADWKIMTTGMAPTRAVAHAKAKADGWVRKGRHRHHCPRCAEELKAQKARTE